MVLYAAPAGGAANMNICLTKQRARIKLRVGGEGPPRFLVVVKGRGEREKHSGGALIIAILRPLAQ
jgi:hypothetical protein